MTANVVAPGFIETAMTAGLPEETRRRMFEDIPAGRLGSGDDVAAAVCYLASEEASYVTGQVLQRQRRNVRMRSGHGAGRRGRRRLDSLPTIVLETGAPSGAPQRRILDHVFGR